MTAIGKPIKVHPATIQNPERETDAGERVQSVPVRPSRRHANIRRIIREVPDLEPEKEKEKVRAR
jgi:hypothetical protein